MIQRTDYTLSISNESIEAGGFDDDVTAAVTIQEYGARITALEQLVGSSALEPEFEGGTTLRLWAGNLFGLRGSTISAVAVYHGSQAKVFPQSLAFVIGTKQPWALQFGNNHLDEILATTG